MTKSNSQNIAALLDRKYEVKVRGEIFVLSAPSAEATRELYTYITEHSDVADGDAASGLQMGLEMSIKSIMACMPDITQEEAERLLPLSGGATAEVASLARSLCGLEVQSKGENDRSF